MVQFSNVMFFVFHAKYSPLMNELRPVMNGIYINLAPGALTFVGTDAHKLVKYESEAENEVGASFILPKKPANLLKSVLLKEEDRKSTRLNSSHIQKSRMPSSA